MSDHDNNQTSSQREVVTFRINAQEFGVDILCVREIRGWTEPVQRQMVGLLVDGVSDILSFASDAVQATPDIVADQSMNFVPSVLMMDGRMISMISLEDILPQSLREAA